MISGSIADGENLAFTIPNDGKRYFPEIRVLTISAHTLTIQRYSESLDNWYSTGDTITEQGIHYGESNEGGQYRVLCSGGTGSADLEIGV